MKVTLRLRPFLLLAGLLAPAGHHVAAQSVAAPAGAAAVPAAADKTYPQIVRLRYVEGDVRVARGDQSGKQRGSGWEIATADLPLATGYSVVTGAGRAEIELEDASSVFLAENSSLSLDDLHTTAGAPHTTMTLLAGTLTLHVHSTVAGESFVLKTPTDGISVPYPEKAYLRVDSYLDATAVTPQKDESFTVTGATVQAPGKGQTVFYSGGKVIAPGGKAENEAAWDSWVAERVASRSAALAAVTAASGLPSSTPGLADMYAQGVFFSCAPYGTCWEPPADQSAAPAAAAAAATSTPEFDMFLGPDAVRVEPGGQTKTKVSVVGLGPFTGTVAVTAAPPPGFACGASCAFQLNAGQMQTLALTTDASVAPGTYAIPITGSGGGYTQQATLTVYVTAPVDTGFALPFAPAVPPYCPCFVGAGGMPVSLSYPYGPYTHRYAWAVCHTGEWLYRNHVYVWVVRKGREHHRHHRPPVRWVKGKSYTGYVPVHPKDVAGKPPVNRRHEVYSPDKKGETVQRVELDPKKKIEELPEPPKQFRTERPVPLADVAAPSVTARPVKDRGAAVKTGVALQFGFGLHGLGVMRPGVGGESPKDVTGHAADLRTHDNHVEPIGKTRISTPKAPRAPKAPKAPRAGGGTHAGGTHGGGGHAGGGHAGGGRSGGGGHGGGGHH
jgi:uncharacterized membrane protein YgcG